jgi:hypothetical protein
MRNLPTKTAVEDAYARYGCRVNEMSVEQLFAAYEEAGFLYPEKLKRLAPYLATIRSNWQKAIGTGGDLMSVVSTNRENGSGIASVSFWRNTTCGLVTQHLVSTGTPLDSRAVLLSTVNALTTFDDCESKQIWFRPNNKYPQRIFGSMVSTIGPDRSSVTPYGYFVLPRNQPFVSGRQSVEIANYDLSAREAFLRLVLNTRGSLYIRAEELYSEDFSLSTLDSRYQQVGLRRFRQIRLAYINGSRGPIAATIAYRGPLGLNFSFLENRTDLIVAPEIPSEQLSGILAPLLEATLESYSDFELDWVPLTAPESERAALADIGAQFLRTYSQAIWVREAFRDFYRHIDGFYTRLIDRATARAERCARRPALVAPVTFAEREGFAPFAHSDGMRDAS